MFMNAKLSISIYHIGFLFTREKVKILSLDFILSIKKKPRSYLNVDVSMY